MTRPVDPTENSGYFTVYVDYNLHWMVDEKGLPLSEHIALTRLALEQVLAGQKPRKLKLDLLLTGDAFSTGRSGYLKVFTAEQPKPGVEVPDPLNNDDWLVREVPFEYFGKLIIERKSASVVRLYSNLTDKSNVIRVLRAVNQMASEQLAQP